LFSVILSICDSPLVPDLTDQKVYSAYIIDVYIPTCSGDFIYKTRDFLHHQWGFSYNDEELAIVDMDFLFQQRDIPLNAGNFVI